MSKPRRYAGASPFQENQSNIFFGRESAAVWLHRMIKQETIVVLHAKSGIGKSSLIRAGILPRLRKDNSLEPLEFRLFASASGKEGPLATTKQVIRKRLPARSEADTPIDKLLPNDQSLWRILKEIQIQRIIDDSDQARNDPPLLLIFDQFEELFTYSRREQLVFRSELAEAMSHIMPQRYWDILSLYEGMEGPLTPAEKRLMMQPMHIHVLFSIREDRLHLLGELSDYLPNINKNWFKLDHLNAEEAARAIEAPARQPGEFATAAFEYETGLKKEIINYLSGEYEGIESAQLQVICDAIDRKMAGRPDRVATKEIVGDLENITANYYWEKINAIGDPEQEEAARKLIEEQLIFEEGERRLTLYEGQVLESGVSEETLDLLVDSYLLRAEPDLRGGYNYEISHDSLVNPILEAKNERLVQERWAEQERKEAEQRQRLEEEMIANRRAKRLNIILTILLFVSLVAVGFSIWSYQAAKDRRIEAENLLEKFKAAQEELLEANRVTEQSQRKKIRMHLSNADIYLGSQDTDFAKEEVDKARQTANELQTTEYDNEINRMRLRIQTAMKNDSIN